MVPEGVQPQAKKICAEVVEKNPGKVRNVWGYHTTPDHNNRRCVDYMIFDKAGGDQIVKYHLDNRQRLLVDLIIWNRRILRSYPKPDITPWTWAEYRGDDPHTDHPHVQYKEGNYVPPKPAVKPSWLKDPIVKLLMAKVPGPVDHLQGVVKVAPVTSGSKKFSSVYILAQDPGAKGDTRFLAFSTNGTYINSMTVKDGGHGASFHAYRSAAGNLYIWTLIGDVAYRIAWQPGKTITARSGGVQKMAYGTARPVGTYESYIGFRASSGGNETFSIHDRFGYTDPKNNSAKALKRVTVPKDARPVQQTVAMSLSRIYRFRGHTNTDAGKGSKLHVLDVLDWSGKVLLKDFDVTAMSLPGATSDEPEGLTFTGTPGSLLVGKRSGPTNKSRTYPIWQMTGLP